MNLQLDAEALYAELRQGVRALLAAPRTPPAVSAPRGGQEILGRPGDFLHEDSVLVGIWSGGAWLAERLQRDLGLSGAHGVISSTLHRDDFSERGLASGTDVTQLPFAIDGRHIVLIDDVLYTGRTIRAVVNELFDFGRPASVTLAVLVDRGGRELPIAAAYSAARIALPATKKLSLEREADGRFSFVVTENI
ncbi:MAG: bifunctional pyr operon transcriptional regulator/uracil phosphoribosyltransferase PyrR [Rubrivivax sp.]|nr:bifunctional pyr operon transcriptional regulator/uracil phosphoribosyltransferase PyrR [Rubrivivax sp.]